MLDDLPEDKAKWITMDGDKLVFNILDPVVAIYGLKRTFHELNPSSASDIYYAVRAAARFFKVFNGVSVQNPDLEKKIQIEFTKLGSSKGDVDDTPNLYRNGVVNIVIEKENIALDDYGLKVTTNTPEDLYLGVLSLCHIHFVADDQSEFNA